MLTALLLSWTSASAQLRIDGRTAVLDSLTSTWLCTVPEDVFGTDFTTTVTMDGATDITVNGTAVGDEYTFAGISGKKTWTLGATKADGSTSSTHIAFTFLPIVVIEGEVDKENYNTGTVSVLLPDEDIVSPCKMKFRGSATNSHIYFKRNYHLKFVDEAGNKADYKFFENLRNDNNWLLDAGTLDRLRIRNRVLTDLWADMGSKPYYSDVEPKALNSSRGKMVEVFRNGEYQGMYNMCEPIDRKQMKLLKTDEENGIINGLLWKTDVRTAGTMMQECTAVNNSRNLWNGFEVKYPDFEEVNPTNFGPLADAVRFVAESSDIEFAQQVSDYFDVPVLVDYFIFMQFTLAYDNMGKNVFWAIRDLNEDKKLTLGVWDFDTSLGQSWKRYEYHPDYLTPDVDLFTMRTADNYMHRLIKWNVDGFVDKAGERYRALRKGVLATDSIKQRFMTYLDMLDKCGATQREYTRWYKCSDLGGLTADLVRETPFVMDWIEKRMEFMDVYFAHYATGDINRNGSIDISDINALVSNTLGIEENKMPDIYSYRLDLNGDKSVDITDINHLTNIIMNR